MWWLVIAALWGYGLYLAWRVVHDGRTSQGSLCWIVTLVMLPPVAIPLHWMIGDRRLEGYRRARRNGMRRLDEALRVMHASLEPFRIEAERASMRVLSRLAHLPWTSGNSIRRFDDAETMYASLESAVDAARSTIQVQFYIYRDDDIGRLVRDAIARAAARGVRVWFMYDEIGCGLLGQAYFEPLRQAGVQVSGFRTVPSRRRLLRLNFRNHRKLVVIDGSTVFFGGMNVGCEYCGRDETIGQWRDTHAKATGPVALAAQLVFLEDWHWAQRVIPTEFDWSPRTRTAPNDEKPVEAMLMFPSGPVDDRDEGVLLFLQLISQAKERLWIATPYFVCDDSILQAIKLAKLRGVDVRILIPANPDNFLVRHAARAFAAEVSRCEIPVYSYNRGFNHQKVVLCDDLASIGSANMDHRSMRLNFEITGLVSDKAFSDDVAAMFVRDMRRAVRLDDGWWEKLRPADRFAARLARLAGPVL
jgi:cardiolipin synthase